MTILLTKVRSPQRRKDVLRRVRLVDTLHQNLHRKLTFVSAPAGYGKTTLLVDFAADVDAIVCWYRIGPEDGDLVLFVQHILASFQQQFPGFGKTLEERLNSPSGSSDAPSLATELINEVQRQVQDFCVLILDDYHLAGENQQIVDFLESFLEHLPDQLRILIGSRSVYGIPTASLYIRDELVTISADELRFRADELQKLVLQNYRMRLSQEEAEELANRADGWIIALLLAIRAMENGVMPKFTGGIEKVYEYLAEEVVNRQSDELRDFMLAVSILGDFNEALCNYLLDRKDSNLLLRAMEERNLFVSRTETKEGNSYRFHQLFSEFLQDYFQRHAPKTMQDLHRRAAEWHRGREEWEIAIQHKLAARDKTEAAAWMDAIAGQLYTSDRQKLLARWVDILMEKPQQYSEAPRVLLYQAKSLVNQSSFSASLELLATAEPILKKRRDLEALANATITEGMVYRFTGRYEEAIQAAEKAQVFLGEGKRNKQTRQWYQAERLKGVPFHYLGETQNAIEHLDAAVKGLRNLTTVSEGNLKAIYSYDLAECLNDLGLIWITSGQMLNAQRAFQEALDIHINIRSNLGALASARNNIAYLHHQVGHYSQAWKEYSLALENARTANRAREQIAILSGRGFLLLDLEEPVEAGTNFEQAIDLGEKSGEKQELVPVYLGMARVERIKKNYNEAMNWLRRAASQSGALLDNAEYSLELGSIYIKMDQEDLALRELRTVFENWSEKLPPKQNQVAVSFLAACILFRQGKTDLASDLLARAMNGGARLGYDQFLLPITRDWMQVLAKQGKYLPEQCIALIERARDFSAGLDVLNQHEEIEAFPAMQLEVRSLGPGEIRQNGQIVPSTIWRSSRARALFLYILDRGKVRKEAIGLDFWPDFSPGKISSNFHATLWRVRQALGHKDSILFEADHYSLHPSIQVWYDVSEFQNYLRQTHSSHISSAERNELLRQAIRLYLGPYLQDVYMEWVDQKSEDLRNQYLDALVQLGKAEMDSKHYRDAKELYEKIISIDPYRDEVHLALMKCLVNSGSNSAAIAHFKRYKALLRKELNSEPLLDLQNYYNQLAN